MKSSNVLIVAFNSNISPIIFSVCYSYSILYNTFPPLSMYLFGGAGHFLDVIYQMPYSIKPISAKIISYIFPFLWTCEFEVLEKSDKTTHLELY